jgi:guanylate kinase
VSRLLSPDEVEKFRSIIDGYRLHESVVEQFRSSNFAVIAGPAGAGKDTLRDNLISRFPDRYLPILSTTTRPPRQNEVDGETYHFWEIDRVEKSLNNQEFFQAALVHNQQISCLHIDEIKKLSSDNTGLSILVVQTERQLRKIKSDLKTVFLTPPDFETLKKRLYTERILNEEELARRLSSAKYELQSAVDSPEYYCVVSDTIDRTVKVADEYLQGKESDASEGSKAREIIKSILGNLSDVR